MCCRVLNFLSICASLSVVSDDVVGWRFFEPFELPDVGLGELSGQHGWRVGEPASAVVQTKTARSGRAALLLKPEESDDDGGFAMIERSVPNADGVVWVDSYCVATPAKLSAGALGDGGFFFSFDAHPVMLDGETPCTNIGNIT